ncbi:unnamed protein product [Lepeophtheirus salmonis]|uniref:(salmon louse) hypothetical protein n=1 Tax=Lepeophtheirus salmonis TaxID=72036 RepID=A0A7R8CJH1_LEPSM|nr:unnamed protein product [Lepeophtheirus salmonis]CAF2838693.1 unnamed protein product [Lepeophtheirus salmonis]
MHINISLINLKSRLCLREHLNKEESIIISSIPTATLSYIQRHLIKTSHAIIYISLAVVVYVAIVIWLVSSNFHSTLNSRTPSYVQREKYPTFIDGEDFEGEEAVLIVRDQGNGLTSCSSVLLVDELKEGAEAV